MTLIAIAAAIFKRLNTACLSYDRVFLPLDLCFVHRLFHIHFGHFNTYFSATATVLFKSSKSSRYHCTISRICEH